MMNLPPDQGNLFWQDLQQYEREKPMPYIPREEQLKQICKWETLLESIKDGLELKFGQEGSQLGPALHQLYDLDKLRAIHRALFTATSLEEVRNLVLDNQSQ